MAGAAKVQGFTWTVEVDDVVDVRRDGRTIDAVELADEAHQIRARRRHIVARDVELGAIARRQHTDREASLLFELIGALSAASRHP
jgi:hypothetical protein